MIEAELCSFFQDAFAWTWVIRSFPSTTGPNLPTISLPRSTVHPTQLQLLTALGTQTRAPKNSPVSSETGICPLHSAGEYSALQRLPYKKWDIADLNLLPVFLLSNTNTTASLSPDITSRCPSLIRFAEWCSCAHWFVATDNRNMNSSSKQEMSACITLCNTVFTLEDQYISLVAY